MNNSLYKFASQFLKLSAELTEQEIKLKIDEYLKSKNLEAKHFRYIPSIKSAELAVDVPSGFKGFTAQQLGDELGKLTGVKVMVMFNFYTTAAKKKLIF